MKRAVLIGAVLLTAAGALALRLPFLDLRPMHGDEANQAVKTGQLLDEGVYRYDPHDHHGPTLYYFGLVSAWLSGAQSFADTEEATYRLVPIVFGVAMVAIVTAFHPVLTGYGVIAAAALLALSPAMVFYSRYYIQETLLVCFTLMLLAFLQRYLTRPSAGAAASIGIAAGLMHATKETCVIAFFAMAVGLVAYAPSVLAGAADPAQRRRTAIHAGCALTAAIVVSVTFFSSFYTYPRGVLDSILTYGNYLGRAGGAGLHDKPWTYYLRLLGYTHRGPGPWWSEGAILALAALGGMVAAMPRALPDCDKRFQRFLLIYAGAVTVVYSAIPYKTPWTVLTMLQAFVLLAGLGVAWLVARPRHVAIRAVAAALVAAALLHLGRQAYRANFEVPADPRNPYVYAHTSSAFMRLVQRMEDLAGVHPEGRQMIVKVIQPDGDYWPIPWYLRDFPNVGYFHDIPEDPDADVIITSTALKEPLDQQLDRDYTFETQGLRPSVLRLVYIRRGLWEAFMKTRA